VGGVRNAANFLRRVAVERLLTVETRCKKLFQLCPWDRTVLVIAGTLGSVRVGENRMVEYVLVELRYWVSRSGVLWTWSVLGTDILDIDEDCLKWLRGTATHRERVAALRWQPTDWATSQATIEVDQIQKARRNGNL